MKRISILVLLILSLVAPKCFHISVHLTIKYGVTETGKPPEIKGFCDFHIVARGKNGKNKF